MSDDIEIYWVPGCSACLRMKEFLERSGKPYTAINLALEPSRYSRLTALGLTAPAVVRGDRGVPGMDLTAIASLIGIDYAPPKILPPLELVAKYAAINAALCRFMALIPDEGMDYKSPDRDRSVRELVAHAGSGIQEFLHATTVDSYRYGRIDAGFMARFATGGSLGATGTQSELIDYVSRTGAEFRTWWDELGFDDPLDRVVSTPFGHVTLHEIMERGVWHTAQHTRQLEYFLTDRLGVTVSEPLTADDLAGLPLPDRVHA